MVKFLKQDEFGNSFTIEGNKLVVRDIDGKVIKGEELMSALVRAGYIPKTIKEKLVATVGKKVYKIKKAPLVQIGEDTREELKSFGRGLQKAGKISKQLGTEFKKETQRLPDPFAMPSLGTSGISIGLKIKKKKDKEDERDPLADMFKLNL